MPGNHDPLDDAELRNVDRGDRDDTPVAEDDDREHRVARRPNPLPNREEEEEELAEADILEELDLDDLEDNDDIFDRQ